jgi:hypothetical protein
VDAKPLALVLAPAEIAAARLVKIDVEGAEWNVISEMKSWLSCCRPDVEIIIELSGRMLKSQEKTITDVFDFFAGFGFFPYFIENDHSGTAYHNHCQSWPPVRAQTPTDLFKDQFDTIFFPCQQRNALPRVASSNPREDERPNFDRYESKDETLSPVFFGKSPLILRIRDVQALGT